MPREWGVRHEYRRTPWPPYWIRVVKHDKPEALKLEPEVEREWTRLHWRRRIVALLAGAATLGLTWMLAEVIAYVIRGVR
jgi:hypothetical protein